MSRRRPAETPKAYVMARTAGKRPTLQHRLSEIDPTYTRCGIYIMWWPWRLYQIDPMEVMLCLKCEPRDL